MKQYDLIRSDHDWFGNVCVRETDTKKADYVKYILFRFNPQLREVTIVMDADTYEAMAPTPMGRDYSIGTVAEPYPGSTEEPSHTGSSFSNPYGLASMEDAWILADYERTLRQKAELLSH